MLSLAALWLAPAAALPARQHDSFPRFARHRIDAIASRLGQTALADMDRDGDLDEHVYLRNLSVDMGAAAGR